MSYVFQTSSPLDEMKAAAANMKQREADHRRGSEDETIKADTIMYERLSLEDRIELIEARAQRAREAAL